MRLSGQQILEAVSYHMRIHPNVIRGRTKFKQEVAARRIIAKRMIAHGYTPSQIARLLQKDHSTVLVYVNPIYKAYKRAYFREWKRRREMKKFKPEQFYPINQNSNLAIISGDTGKEARDIYNVLASINVDYERDAYWPHKEPK